MRKAISFLLLLSLAPFVHALATTSPAPVRFAPRTDETQIWDLEKAYWEYVKANDLEKYRALWHERAESDKHALGTSASTIIAERQSPTNPHNDDSASSYSVPSRRRARSNIRLAWSSNKSLR